MISISGHKIHAPKGIGALYIKTGVKIKPFILGGSQEAGMRAGTEAMPQIAAFGAACEIARAGMKLNCEKWLICGNRLSKGSVPICPRYGL